MRVTYRLLTVYGVLVSPILLVLVLEYVDPWNRMPHGFELFISFYWLFGFFLSLFFYIMLNEAINEDRKSRRFIRWLSMASGFAWLIYLGYLLANGSLE